jgi:hypothetical protein
MIAVLVDQNRLASATRCAVLASGLAGVLGDQPQLFGVRQMLFWLASITGRDAEAERRWDQLDRMSRPGRRASYRPGDAERLRVEFEYRRFRLGVDEFQRALRIARQAHNRPTVRALRRLRGAWLLRGGDVESAVGTLADVVRMARENGIIDTAAETRLALARYLHGELPTPRVEADRLAALRSPAHSPLAELWQTLGDTARATHHALAAYRWAWADGEPYVHRYELDQAAALLAELGADIPTLPAYDPAADPALPFEAQVEAAIERLRAEKNT